VSLASIPTTRNPGSLLTFAARNPFPLFSAFIASRFSDLSLLAMTGEGSLHDDGKEMNTSESALTDHPKGVWQVLLEQGVLVVLERLACVIDHRDDARVHTDRVHRTGLDTVSAEDAAGHVDVEGNGILHDSGVFMLARLDADAPGWTYGRAAHAGNAAGRAVLALHQAVPPAPARMYEPGLVGIPDRYRILERVRYVLEEMTRRYRDSPEDFRKIEPFPEVQFRFHRHRLILQVFTFAAEGLSNR